MQKIDENRIRVVWGHCDIHGQRKAEDLMGGNYSYWIDGRKNVQGTILESGAPVCAPTILGKLGNRPFVWVLDDCENAKKALLGYGYTENEDFSICIPCEIPKKVELITNSLKKTQHGFYSGYQEEEKYYGIKADVKVLAFYLPQFHCFPENDKWWGKGFTEWTNSRKAKPLFEGHYQPRNPHRDIGYYNLLDINVLKRQAELAKRHCLYGFCFYYYWFSGHRLMEKPLDMLLNHPEIDINFCLCWANENWTRRWDGRDQDVLIAQEYNLADPEQFILDIKKYLLDDRYIRVKGKPIIIIYELGKIPKLRNVIEEWKRTAKECGIGDISVWSTRVSGNTANSLGVSDLVDMEIEFPPRDMHKMQKYTVPYQNVDGYKGMRLDYSTFVYNVLRSRNEMPLEKVYRTVMVGWDNTPRRSGYSFCASDNFDLKRYYDWLRANVEEAERVFEPEERFVFINAWNEWGEGTYLDPDERYGYASINATSRAVLKQNFYMTVENKAWSAVQAHVFHTDLLTEIIEHTNKISELFDLYISTDTCKKASDIREQLKSSKANHCYVTVMDNRGRDVMPFLLQMNKCYEKYKYLIHLHTKRTKHLAWAGEWRKYLYESLLPSKTGIDNIVNRFETDRNLGVLYPEHFKKIRPWLDIPDSNHDEIVKLLLKLKVRDGMLDDKVFPSGDMFWARTEAVKEMFDDNFKYEDFPLEQGQRDGTVMHAIERCWCKVAAANGYRCETI